MIRLKPKKEVESLPVVSMYRLARLYPNIFKPRNSRLPDRKRIPWQSRSILRGVRFGRQIRNTVNLCSADTSRLEYKQQAASILDLWIERKAI